MPLAAHQLAQFAQRGYLVFPSLFDIDQMLGAADAIRRIVLEKLVDLDIEPAYREGRQPMPDDPELAVRKIMWFGQADDRLKALRDAPRLLAILEQLLGEKTQVLQEMALLKPAHVGVEKPPHQDNAYFLVAPPEKVIGVWIALDEATVDNGCMRVVPGSHLAGPVPHQHLRDCQIPDARVAYDRAVPIPLSPGGALVFSGLLHHYTLTNRSPHRRRALQFHYGALSCHRLSEAEHGRLFSENGKYAGCAVFPRERAEALVIE